jgi:hypothetical protein
MGEQTTTAHCANCRSEVDVPDGYSHGDLIRCGVCGTSHRIVRGEGVRLVLSDVTPLRDALRELEGRRERLGDELTGARGRLGIGSHGLYLGLAYVLYQVALNDQVWTVGLILQGAAVALVAAIALEVMNYYFLSKRQKMTQLEAEIEAVHEEELELRRKLREASRH